MSWREYHYLRKSVRKHSSTQQTIHLADIVRFTK